MTEIDVKLRDLKASIADVLPIMKRKVNAYTPVLSFTRVVSDGGAAYFEATDRFVAIHSIFARATEGETFPKFDMFVDVDVLTALKGYGAQARVAFDREGFSVYTDNNRTRFSATIGDDWPNISPLINGPWDDDAYFTPGPNTGKSALNPEWLKHIKDVRVTPRLNDMAKPWRIEAKDRVKGIVMPARFEVGE